MRRIYELIYIIVRFLHVPIPWVFGKKPELKELIKSGRITPGRAIDLGCGAGLEAIFLSKNGFDVTGIDYSPTAIKLARKRAEAEDVNVDFIQDDLTDLQYVNGTFDFLIDYGALNDLKQNDRDDYIKNVLPLSHANSQFLLMCFENSLSPDEIDRRFGDFFNIETLSRKSESIFRRTITVYLMTRK